MQMVSAAFQAYRIKAAASQYERKHSFPGTSLGVVLSMQVPTMKAMERVCDDGPVRCTAVRSRGKGSIVACQGCNCFGTFGTFLTSVMRIRAHHGTERAHHGIQRSLSAERAPWNILLSFNRVLFIILAETFCSSSPKVHWTFIFCGMDALLEPIAVHRWR